MAMKRPQAGGGKLPPITPPTFEQQVRESLRAYALPDAPVSAPSENEYEGPSISMLQETFPGQITIQANSPWIWSRDPAHQRPPQIQEASKVFHVCGGSALGPALWFDRILMAKRGNTFRFSPFTTLYIPIDLFANIDEQMRESKHFCETAKRKLVELSGRRPIRRGAKHDQALAEGILMVVLRDWGRLPIGAIARYFYKRNEEHTRRLTTRRVHSVRKLLKAHVPWFKELSRPTK